MGAAVCVALAVAAAVLVRHGVNQDSLDTTLFLTGRLNFLLFLAAYVGGPLVALFGGTFAWLRRRGREFGLAFASALVVHLGLVAWLCAIGAAPTARTFVFFGIAVVFIYLMVLFSIAPLQRALGARGWALLRTAGQSYVAYAFAVDFLNDPLGGGPRRVLAYLPFAILALAGPALRFAAFARRVGLVRRIAALRPG